MNKRRNPIGRRGLQHTLHRIIAISVGIRLADNTKWNRRTIDALNNNSSYFISNGFIHHWSPRVFLWGQNMAGTLIDSRRDMIAVEMEKWHALRRAINRAERQQNSHDE